jgi:DNA invertase Pin-like site-specific DNA recombinase
MGYLSFTWMMIKNFIFRNRIEHFRKDDELFVWRLDRLGRSLKHIIDLVLNLSNKGIIINFSIVIRI